MDGPMANMVDNQKRGLEFLNTNVKITSQYDNQEGRFERKSNLGI